MDSQSDSSSVFSYFNQMTLYSSLHIYLQFIFELMIWEILDLLFITTGSEGWIKWENI